MAHRRLAFVVAVVGVAILGGAIARAEEDLRRLSALDDGERARLYAEVRKGEGGDDAEVVVMEARLAAQPTDVATRLRLVGRRAADPKSASRVVDLVVGLVEHNASVPVADAVPWLLEHVKAGEDGWKKAGDAWAQAITAREEPDPTVMGNAGLFFTTTGRPEGDVEKGVAALSFARTAKKPDPRFLLRLVELPRGAVSPAVRYEVGGAAIGGRVA